MINPIQTLKLGGKAAALATLMATASIAQTAITDNASDVAADPSITTMEGVQFPELASVETDQQVIDGLSEQGYENVVVTREGEAVRVTAERAGLPTEMVFNSADARLMMVDGVEPSAQPAETAAPAGMTEGAAPNLDAQPGAATDGDEPATETPASSDFGGQEDVPITAPTASTDGVDTDPVEQTIPADAALPVPSGSGTEADGGAETGGKDG